MIRPTVLFLLVAQLVAGAELAAGDLGTGTAADGHLGVVVPAQRVELSAEVGGTIRTLEVALGDSVSSGQSLLTIDVPGLDKQIAKAQASLEGSRSHAAQIDIEVEELDAQLERRSQADDVFTAEELESLQIQRRIKASELAQAQAATRERQAELALLEERDAARNVRAPFDGVVAERMCSLGANVGQGESLLRVIGQDAPIIRFAVPVDEAGWLQPGAAVDVFISSSTGKEVRAAQVLRVSPEMDPAIEMVFAEAEFRAETVESPIANGSVVRVRRVMP